MSERQEFTEDMSGFSEDDRHIERLLASLKPHESHINRDRVMFLAGQASAVVSQRSRSLRLNRWLWPAATACAACAGLSVGVSLGHVRGNPVQVLVEMPRTIQKMATPEQAAQEPIAQTLPGTSEESDADQPNSHQRSNLLALRNRMLATEAEDPSQSGDSFRMAETGVRREPAATYRELLRELLAEKS
jgi:hypothetical protein